MTPHETPIVPRPATFGATFRSFETLESTNSTAKSLALEGAPEGTVVTAERQTAGRGRLDRRWESETGKNLTFSIIVRPRIPLGEMGLLSLLAGTAVCETLREGYFLPAECKWPNDVLLGGKKICGILSEAVHQEGDGGSAVVIGIGMNINQSAFPPELQERATSMLLASGREQDRALVLTRLLLRMEELYATLLAGGAATILERWLDVSGTIGKALRVTGGGGVHEGIARGLSPDGGLLLETAGGVVTIRAGDVTLR